MTDDGLVAWLTAQIDEDERVARAGPPLLHALPVLIPDNLTSRE